VIYSQVRVGEWQSYTSPLAIRSQVVVDNRIISATGGGLLSYDRSSGKFSTLTNIDGLLTTNLASVAADPYGQLWLGGGMPEGVIQIYDFQGEQSVAEFADFGFTEISSFAVTDSLVLGVFQQNQDWGLIQFIYRDDHYIYRDVFKQWPFPDNPTIAAVAIKDNYIYVATNQGLIRGDWWDSNLKNPANWNPPFPQITGEVTSMKLYDDKLLVVANKIIYLIDLETSSITWQWSYFDGTYQLLDIVKSANGAIYGILNKAFIKIGTNVKDWQINTKYYLRNLAVLNDSTILVGTDQGFGVVDTVSRTIEKLVPNAPLTNQFSAVTVLDDGRIVAASKFGLAIKEPNGWRNIVEDRYVTAVHSEFDYDYYAADTLPIDFGGFVADIEQGPDGLIYCGIRGTYPVPNPNYALRGGGIIIIDIDDPLNYTLIDTSVLDYFNTHSNPKPYLVVKDIEFDSQGNLWVGDTYSIIERKTLHVRDNAGNWGHFIANSGQNPLGSAPNSIGFDSWGRIWIGSELWGESPSDAINSGLALLSITGDPIAPITVDWNHVIKNTSVWSLAVNSQNILYMITPDGLISLTLQNSMTNPVIQQSSYLPGFSFGIGSKVRLDSDENVWVTSPNEGVHVILDNTTSWPDLDGFRYSNSSLLSDGVTDLDFDYKRGLVWITSTRGLNSLKIPFKPDEYRANDLLLFPSPFHIPDQQKLTIDGIYEGAVIKIMAINGNVVRTINSQNDNDAVMGYQVFWDGKSENGELVGSGVYLIMVFSNTGKTQTGKIAVIRN